MVNQQVFKSHRWIFSDPLRFRCMEFSTITVTHVVFFRDLHAGFSREMIQFDEHDIQRGEPNQYYLSKIPFFLFNSKVNVISKYIYIYIVFFHLYLGKIPILTIFFNRVETTTQKLLDFCKGCDPNVVNRKPPGKMMQDVHSDMAFRSVLPFSLLQVEGQL